MDKNKPHELPTFGVKEQESKELIERETESAEIRNYLSAASIINHETESFLNSSDIILASFSDTDQDSSDTGPKNSVTIKQQLQSIAHQASQLNARFQVRLYELLREETGKVEKYDREVTYAKNKLVSSHLEFLLKQDVVAAVEYYETIRTSDPEFVNKYLDHSELKRAISQVFKTALGQGLPAVVECLNNFPPGFVKSSIASEQAALACRNLLLRNGAATAEEIKNSASSSLELTHALWNFGVIHFEKDVSVLLKEALEGKFKQGVRDYSIALLGSESDRQKLLEDPELQKLVVTNLYSENNYKLIADYINYLKEGFFSLPPYQQQTVIAAIERDSPGELYRMREVAKFTPTQRKAIIKYTKETNWYTEFFDPEFVHTLGITKAEQDAVLEYLLLERQNLFFDTATRDKLPALTREQKQYLVNELLPESGLDQYTYYNNLFIVLEHQEYLELTEQEVGALLDKYLNSKQSNPEKYFDKPIDFQSLNTDQRQAFAMRALGLFRCNETMKNKLSALVFSEPEKVLGAIADFKNHDRKDYSYYKFSPTAYSADHVLVTIFGNPEIAADMLALAQEPPYLLQNPELSAVLYQRSWGKEIWPLLRSLQPSLARIPAEALTPALLSALVVNPGSIDKVLEVVETNTMLAHSAGLSFIATNPGDTEQIISFIDTYPQLASCDISGPAFVKLLENSVDPHKDKDLLVLVFQNAPELLLLNNFDWHFGRWDRVYPAAFNKLLPQYIELRAELPEGVTGDLYYLFHDKILGYINGHPERLDDIVALFRSLPPVLWQHVIPNNLPKILDNPSSWKSLSYIAETKPDLCKNYDTAEFVWELAARPELLGILELEDDKQRFSLHRDVLDYLAKHPGILNAYVKKLEKIPRRHSFPADFIAANIENFMSDDTYVENIAKLYLKQDMLFVKRYINDQYEAANFVLHNFDQLKPLLETAPNIRDIVFSVPVLSHAAQYPDKISAMLELAQTLASVVSSQQANNIIPFALQQGAECIEAVKDISVRAPGLLRSPLIQSYLKNPKAYELLVAATSRAQAFLFSNRIFSYCIDFPQQIPEIVDAMEQLPEGISLEPVSENFEKWFAIPKEKRAEYIAVFLQIERSPSIEVKRLKEALLTQIINTNYPTEAYKKIESVFIKNNLPTFGKIFKIFEILYNDDAIKVRLKQTSSPTLLKATPKRRKTILYKDLLNIHIESGNPSLRQYVEVLQTGEEILNKAESQGVGSLSDFDQRKLGFFLDKLDTLRANSGLPDSLTAVAGPQGSLEQRMHDIRANLKVKPSQTIGQRLTEMFCSAANVRDFNELAGRMKQAKAAAHERNMESVLESPDGFLVLKPGDLLKGSHLGPQPGSVTYLTNILQNGSVAKEFLGVDAQSDLTPFDTDVSMVLEEDRGSSFKNMVEQSLAPRYGNLLLGIRDRGLFNKSGNTNEAEREGKWELFPTQALGERHYGIRTGFPATEIDFFIANNDLQLEPVTLEKVYFEIAQNGFYIPVVNAEGKLLFTPDMYTSYRAAFQGLERFDGGPFQFQPTEDNQKIYSEVVAAKAGYVEARSVVEKTREDILNSLQRLLEDSGTRFKDPLDSGILGAELVDTGSTGRGTNLPGDLDFDLSVQLDESQVENIDQYTSTIQSHIEAAGLQVYPEGTRYIQIRATGVTKLGETTFNIPVDIDIGITSKSDLAVYASHNAIEDKLAWIEQNVGQEAYVETVANILVAKRKLKDGKAYKKVEHGGFGGVGVEHWVLSNGGSVDAAFKTFYDAAFENGERVPFRAFQERYKILDPGFNIKFQGHDNYVRKLKPEGYEAMCKVVKEYVEEAPA